MNDLAKVSDDPMRDFQDRVIEKLRADFGEMLPNEVVEGLVQRAIDEQFFKPRRVPQRYGQDEQVPSWFVEEVTKLGAPILRKMLADHMKKHEPEIKKAIEEFISTQSLTLLTVAALQNATRQDIMELAQLIVQGVKQG